MREKTCCFTGHRDIPFSKIDEVSANLERAVEKAVKAGYCYFGAGGALGFDTIAAETILKMKDRYSHIRLILVLPCKEQTRGWSTSAKEKYAQILQRADKTVYVSEHYTRSCMHQRNRHLVDNSSLCICYLERASGGTAYTVEYARKKGLTIENIAEKKVAKESPLQP